MKTIKLIGTPYFDFGDGVYQDFEFEGCEYPFAAYLGLDGEFDGSVTARKQKCLEEVEMTKEEAR